MALTAVIRSSEATTMMELEIELKKASDTLKGQLVALSVESGIHVAFGTIVSIGGVDEHLNGDPSKRTNHCFVTVDEALDETAPLPVPNPTCQSIGDAIGSHVAWPRYLMQTQDSSKLKGKKADCAKKMRVPLQLDGAQ